MKITTMLLRERACTWLGLALACTLLAACTSTRRVPAPVEDRGSAPRMRVAPGPLAETPRAPPPGAENAGKPGYYTVRPGDTLIRIALESGENWRDIARWNNLDNPNVIEVGQALRVVPPGSESAAAHPLPPAPATSAPLPPVAASSAARPPVAATAPQPSHPPAGPGEEEVAWSWPTVGAANILAGFDEQKNKGVDIGGRAGDPVLAAADGRVVYAGAGLRGYGNLIILKHNNTYLTAYAHNQALLVKEDQSVRKGQKIAEMGSTDADRVKLHFEIRRQGKPVDPLKYLPPR
jgi:lipoprotein NlpD